MGLKKIDKDRPDNRFVKGSGEAIKVMKLSVKSVRALASVGTNLLDYCLQKTTDLLYMVRTRLLAKDISRRSAVCNQVSMSRRVVPFRYPHYIEVRNRCVMSFQSSTSSGLTFD